MSDDIWQNPPTARPRFGCMTLAFAIVVALVVGLIVAVNIGNLIDNRQNAAKLTNHLRGIGLSKWIDQGRLVVKPRPVLHFASDRTFATITVPPNEIIEVTNAITKAGYTAESTTRPATQTDTDPDSPTRYTSGASEESIFVNRSGRVEIIADTFYYP